MVACGRTDSTKESEFMGGQILRKKVSLWEDRSSEESKFVGGLIL